MAENVRYENLSARARLISREHSNGYLVSGMFRDNSMQAALQRLEKAKQQQKKVSIDCLRH